MGKIPLEVLKEKVGTKVLDDLRNDVKPTLTIPYRGYGNIKYDEETGVLRIGDRTFKRKMSSLGEVKKFAQTLAVARIIQQSLTTNKPVDKRRVFYRSLIELPNKKSLVKEQSETDKVIMDLEALVGVSMEDLNVIARTKGEMVGDLRIQAGKNPKGEDVTIDCANFGDGAFAIPGLVKNIKFLDCKADMVLVVEKGTEFQAMNLSKWWYEHKVILITSGGQPCRSVRRIVNRMSTELKLPIHVLVDGDPWGWGIHSVYKRGSMALAQHSDKLACPKAKFLGISATDIFEYKIQRWSVSVTKLDLKRAKEMLEKPWFKDEYWQRQLKFFLRKKRKCEIESFSGPAMDYLADTYLPEKLGLK